MSTAHKTASDYTSICRSMSGDLFEKRHPFPFLFGREVLEEEFRFSTLVTTDDRVVSDTQTQTATAGGGHALHASLQNIRRPQPTDVFRIRHWVITVKKPDNAPAQDRIFLGRGETNDICVPHKTVSKLHAYFTRDATQGGKWYVVDTGSANGTKHNGMRIPPRAKVALYDGDTICFGRCVFQWMAAKSLHERVLALAGQDK